jgi:hypothetical protein
MRRDIGARSLWRRSSGNSIVMPGPGEGGCLFIRKHSFAVSPHELREVFGKHPALRNQRAQGTPDARCTRGLVCKHAQKNAHEHTGSAEAIRHSLRNGFTAYNALSPVTGLSCHRHRRDTSRQLSASIGAPEPHAFAVRFSRARQSQLSRPPHPTARFVTIASRPSCRVRRSEKHH